MMSTVCSICGCADEEAAAFGGMHPDCARRTGRWYQRAFQAVFDFLGL